MSLEDWFSFLIFFFNSPKKNKTDDLGMPEQRPQYAFLSLLFFYSNELTWELRKRSDVATFCFMIHGKARMNEKKTCNRKLCEKEAKFWVSFFSFACFFLSVFFFFFVCSFIYQQFITNIRSNNFRFIFTSPLCTISNDDWPFKNFFYKAWGWRWLGVPRVSKKQTRPTPYSRVRLLRP